MKTNTQLTEVFVLRVGDQEVWRAIADGIVIAADFNCKGAAQAAIPVERRRRQRKAEERAAFWNRYDGSN